MLRVKEKKNESCKWQFIIHGNSYVHIYARREREKNVIFAHELIGQGSNEDGKGRINDVRVCNQVWKIFEEKCPHGVVICHSIQTDDTIGNIKFKHPEFFNT